MKHMIKATNLFDEGDRMMKWSQTVDASCALCQCPIYSSPALLSTQVWKPLVKGIIGSLFSTDWDVLVNHLRNSNYDRLKLFILRYTLQAIVYSIWRESNGRRHGEDEMSKQRMVAILDKNIRNCLSSMRFLGDYSYDGSLITTRKLFISIHLFCIILTNDVNLKINQIRKHHLFKMTLEQQ